MQKKQYQDTQRGNTINTNTFNVRTNFEAISGITKSDLRCIIFLLVNVFIYRLYPNNNNNAFETTVLA